MPVIDWRISSSGPEGLTVFHEVIHALFQIGDAFFEVADMGVDVALHPLSGRRHGGDFSPWRACGRAGRGDRRVRWKSWISGAGRGRTVVGTTSPKWARTAASMASVLARMPMRLGEVADLACVDDDGGQARRPAGRRRRPSGKGRWTRRRCVRARRRHAQATNSAMPVGVVGKASVAWWGGSVSRRGSLC